MRSLASLPPVIAVGVAVASLVAIIDPAIYARETASWAAQGFGQDCVDLVVIAPALLVAGLRARHGSRGATLVTGGLLLYAAYSFAIYAVTMHFNALFLLYCAIFGASTFALVDLVTTMLVDRSRHEIAPRFPRGAAMLALVAIAVLFASLWLADLVPALVHGRDPASLSTTGQVANVVEVLDLSLVLPAMLIVAAALHRRRPIGDVLAPMLLVFAIAMFSAIAGMTVVMHVRGVAS